MVCFSIIFLIMFFEGFCRFWDAFGVPFSSTFLHRFLEGFFHDSGMHFGVLFYVCFIMFEFG